MMTRGVPKKDRANYAALISTRRGTDGPVKDLPWGCAVTFGGKNWTVAGFDEVDGKTFVRVVDRLLTRELSMIRPEDLSKTTSSPYSR